MWDSKVRLLSLCKLKGADWHFLAREAQRFGGVTRLIAGDSSERSKVSAKSIAVIQSNLNRLEELDEEVLQDIRVAARAGARLITVLDPSFPDTLRLIHNL